MRAVRRPSQHEQYLRLNPPRGACETSSARSSLRKNDLVTTSIDRRKAGHASELDSNRGSFVSFALNKYERCSSIPCPKSSAVAECGRRAVGFKRTFARARFGEGRRSTSRSSSSKPLVLNVPRVVLRFRPMDVGTCTRTREAASGARGAPENEGPSMIEMQREARKGGGQGPVRIQQWWQDELYVGSQYKEVTARVLYSSAQILVQLENLKNHRWPRRPADWSRFGLEVHWKVQGTQWFDLQEL
ncbi:hypothetical protein B0H16DRAFT_1584260, partial [Mycena metata]